MTILRRRLSSGFAVLPTATLEDSRLSFRARGILAFLIAKPDDWQARTESIAKEGTEGRDAVRTAVVELKEAGYYRVVTERQADGRLTRYTEVFDTAQDWVAQEYQDLEAGRLTRKLRRRLEGEAAEGTSTDVGISGVGAPGVGQSGILTSTHTKDPQQIPPTPTPAVEEEVTAVEEAPMVHGQEAAEGGAVPGVGVEEVVPEGGCRAHRDGPGRSCRACGTSPRAQVLRVQQAQREQSKAAAAEANARLLEEVRRRPGRDGMSEAAREEWQQARAMMAVRKAAGPGHVMAQTSTSAAPDIGRDVSELNVADEQRTY
ncbi:hypothetical protein [Streptomyces sp. NPDC049555]|uniref:hypothetical protein n=1 Tax=Streptomyces sp. NPDC049555 TaxID=3154930 RepID=UPI003412A6F1